MSKLPSSPSSALVWRKCVCGAWYWGTEQTDDDRTFSNEIDVEKLAVAINDAQIMGPEWWGRDLLPVAEKIVNKYLGKKDG